MARRTKRLWTDEEKRSICLQTFATFPWELVKDESAAGLNLFIRTYSAFLGPIFAILVVDYFVLRKQELNLDKLYDPEGPYKGVNMAAIIAMCVGIVFALIFSGISWYASLLPAGILYYLLMKHLPSAQRFREN